MWSVLRRTLIRGVDNACSTFIETKRYAGHSKWQNIKHTKAEKDGERAVLFAKLTRQMRVAITEVGTWKPEDNQRLSQIIEIAKKKSMPLATIKNVLEKAAKSHSTMQTTTLDVRGPGGCIIIVELHTDNFRGLKMNLQNVFKKNGATLTDQTVRHVFTHKGFVITELKGDLDEATENAISVGAEDVEEIEYEGQKCFQFTCDAKDCAKVAHQLGRNYNVLSREEIFVPIIFANLSDSEVEKVATLFTKLESYDEIYRIHDNIA